MKIIQFFKKNNSKPNSKPISKPNCMPNKSRKGYSYFSVAVSMVVIGASAAGIYKTAEAVVKKAEQVATNWQN